jgi:hypothetical protein
MHLIKGQVKKNVGYFLSIFLALDLSSVLVHGRYRRIRNSILVVVRLLANHASVQLFQSPQVHWLFQKWVDIGVKSLPVWVVEVVCL